MRLQNFKGSLKINAVLNVVRQCCTIIFPLITFPYVYRVLGSDGFGKYSFSMSICTYFILIAGLGINTYAIREGSRIRDDKILLRQLANELFTINLLTSFLSYVLLIITVLINSKIYEYRFCIAILSISILLITFGTDWINSIYEDFLYITIRYIIFQIISLILLFVLIHNNKDVYKYCFVVLFASYGGNVLNLLYVRKYVVLKPVVNLNLKKHIKPLLILFASALAVTIYVTADITMLGFYYEDSIVGMYSFSSKIYGILKQLINAIVIVAVPRLSYLHSDKNVVATYINKLFTAISCLVFPICAGLFCLSDKILFIAGGIDNNEASISLKILSFSIIFALYASIISNCVLVVNKMEKEFLIATIISAVLNIILNLFILPVLGIIGAAITTLISEMINLFIQYFFSKKALKIAINYCAIIKYLFGALLISLICIISNHFSNEQNIIFSFIVTFVLSVIVYALYLLVLKDDLLIGFFFKSKKSI